MQIKIKLLKVERKGTKYIIKESRDLVVIGRSLTSNESALAVQTKLNITRKVLVVSFLYNDEKFVQIKAEYFKVERTYHLGQFIELYLSKAALALEDFING
ncbi:MAG: hypothetical protein FWE36_00185 [Erysipelotrichales bacterium]|nr:hypothetical protein [Erysipelotrichales bacterium]